MSKDNPVSMWSAFTLFPEAAESSIFTVMVTGEPDVVTTVLVRVPRPVTM